MKRLRLFLARLLCPKGYAVVEGVLVGPYTWADLQGYRHVLGIAAHSVHAGQLVGLVQSGNWNSDEPREALGEGYGWFR